MALNLSQHLEGGKRKRNERNWVLPLALAGGVALLIQFIVRPLLVFPVSVSDTAMQPTLNKGDRVFLTYPQLTTISTGDIVLVKRKLGRHKLLCRIAAVEGQRISIQSKRVFVNEVEATKPNRFSKDARTFPAHVSSRDNLAQKDVRPGHFFCLADNHDFLQDSRVWGSFANEAVEGKVIYGGILGFDI